MDARLNADLAKWHRVRLAGVVCGVLAAGLLGAGRFLSDDPAQESQAVALVVAGALFAVAATSIWFWSIRQSRRLLARQAADLQREAANVKAAARGSAARVPTTPAGRVGDARFADPRHRRTMTVRKWLLFLGAFVFLALAEFQYDERGNLPIAAVYAAFGLGSLAYGVVLQQRLRHAR